MSFFNRRTVVFLSALAIIGTSAAYVRTNGVAMVPEGSVAVVTRLDGSHASRLLEPGVHAVIPLWESIRVVPLGEKTVTTEILKAKTTEGLPVSVILEVTYTREAKADALARGFTSGSDVSEQLIAEAFAKGFTEYAKRTTGLSFLPVPAIVRGTARDITSSLATAPELSQLGVNVTGVKIDKQWLAPELQVPIDAGVSIQRGIEDLSGKAREEACKNNPNCQ